MADQCIVCEASLQPFHKDLLCDGCRTPTGTPTASDKKAHIAEGVAEPEEFQRTFQIVEGGTQRGKHKLVDSFGYTYTVKRRRIAGTDWQCSVRPKNNPCRAAVTQKPDGTFTVGGRAHNHTASVGAHIVTRITSRIKKEAATELFKPASAIVKEVLLEERTDAPCPSLPRPEYLARIANRFRQQLRPADFD
ncbi:hypothetical protein OS493_016638 [Desmophyllum pertusum]|uniref:FLYWCH-type domain-containing protein n=1 Tax=Desmophyllum pertusum TaxID=174260 RepID=A0A9W9ZDA9_9CNID|nr:hypothetical protein OS493_016638 [Desmophyllum pertusum]